MSKSFLGESTRRDWLRTFVGGAMLIAGGRWGKAAPNAGHVALSPELTEGPYYINLERIRRDITEGKRGLPLRMRLKVIDGASGAPIPGAAIDVWHCDAQGVYSGYHSAPPDGGRGPRHPLFVMNEDRPFPPKPPAPTSTGALPDFWPGGPGGPPPGGFHREPYNKQTFLRGVQLTGADGVAELCTIFPGWYRGRTTHAHVRVHIGGLVADGRYRGGHLAHTGQIFFPEAVTDRVYRLFPYQRKETDRMALAQDGIFLQGGSEIAIVSQVSPQRLEPGLISESSLVIDSRAHRAGHSGPG